MDTTMLLTTHDMNEAEMLCDRIAIMDSGKVVALDTPTALKQRIPIKDGKETTLEDVFLELTGKKLVNPEEESRTMKHMPLFESQHLRLTPIDPEKDAQAVAMLDL